MSHSLPRLHEIVSAPAVPRRKDWDEIEVRFSVRPGQGEPSVLDPGDIVCGERTVRSGRLSNGLASEKSVRAALDAVNNDPALRADLLAKSKAAKAEMDDHNWGNKQNRSAEMQALIDKLENLP
ncbi:hypothetical protein [Streptomyces sp. NPDC088752]|uniref:hypothetical protein n=1 Tax=Streptomyces sp. NPDC088752 TaxID=3154963 RepID=UPI0034370A0B